MSAPRELELKLDISPEDAAALVARGPGGRSGAGITRHLASVYHDTATRRLRDHGLTLRIRQTEGGRVQTVKAVGEAGAGLFQRGEWEAAVPGDAPDLAAADGSPLAGILREHDALRPIFETSLDRTTWMVVRRGSRIEVAIDRGEVVAGDVAVPLAELELELKAGDPAELFGLATSLAQRSALRIGVLTKSDRGHALLDGPGPGAVKAGHVSLMAGMSVAQAFQAIARSAVRQFRMNEPLLAGENHVEALHQARVALRRLRSALSLFRDIVADDEVAGIAGALRRVSQLMGEARNLDVYVARVIRPGLASDEPPPGLVEYLDFIEAERREHARAMAEHLGSAAFRREMLDLVRWIECGPWLRGDEAQRAALRDRPVGAFAVEILARHHKRVAKRGRHLDRLEPEARHKVRIAAKKLRYASEFFGSLISGKKERRRYAAFLDALEDLQDELGDLNDIATGHAIAARFAASPIAREGGRAIALFAAGHVSGGEDQRGETGLAAASRAQRRVARAKPFWTGLSGETRDG